MVNGNTTGPTSDQTNALRGLIPQKKAKTTKSVAAGTSDYAWMENADHQWASAWAWVNGSEAAFEQTRMYHSDAGTFQAIGSRKEGYHNVQLGSSHILDHKHPHSPKQIQEEQKAFRIGAHTGSTRNASGVLNIFIQQAKKNPEQFSKMQQILQRAGYYSSKGPMLGVYGAEDTAAMMQALQDAHTVNIPFKDFLLNRAAKADALGPTLRRVPPVISLTNPVTIRAAANDIDSSNGSSAAGRLIGRSLNEDQTQRFINEVHGGERASQIAADNASPQYQQVDPTTGEVVGASGPQPGGDVVKPADLGAELTAFAKREDPSGYQATQMGERASDILNLMQRHLGGGESVGR